MRPFAKVHVVGRPTARALGDGSHPFGLCLRPHPLGHDDRMRAAAALATKGRRDTHWP
jgi:hypothetical protein